MRIFRDKYERKIEKLMLFVFSIVRYSGKKEAIGPTNSKKSIGTAGKCIVEY